jgi:hypothetical protein
MIINSVTSSALQGIQRGYQGIRRSAAEIASADQMQNTSASKDLTRSLVEMKQHSLHTQASAKVLQTSADLLGTLLDVKA